MTSRDLQYIDATCKLYNENEENDLLRKEREQLIIQKEKDRIKEEIRMKKEKQKLRKINLQNKQIFKSDILTFDSNGKIIKKKINLESIKKDLPKPKLKILGNELNKDTTSTSTQKGKNKIMPIKLNKSNKNNINKKILNTSKEIIFNPNDKELFTDENIRKKNDEEIKLSGNNFELVKPEVGVVISKENKIENKKENKQL